MNKCYGEQLITLGTSIAFKISQDLPPDEIGILGALLTVIGDQLALLSVTKEEALKNNKC